MSNKWTWAFAILTAASFAFGLVFFVATQEVTGRDWVVLGIGALLGATATALMGTFIFHSSGRAKKFAADTSRAQQAADSESKGLDEESRARIESERLSAVAENDRLDKLAVAETALIEKRTALLEALPTRSERLNELEDNVAELRIRIEDANGHFKAGEAQALDAANHGFRDMAFENQSAADTWKLAKERFEAQLRAAEADIESLKIVSDEEYLEEQKRLRGLD
ncbi:hypothetical protein [Arthrobacter yangruifuii]|uniref:hypothetical protein n=1 Tax=Arthrobacter yangruifuii TaxID=2606616 RepID=UPI0011B828BC|nr:hypothetical protein [Arthrobacter yangruifuii]